jgi:hypothetical protein
VEEETGGQDLPLTFRQCLKDILYKLCCTVVHESSPFVNRAFPPGFE